MSKNKKNNDVMEVSIIRSSDGCKRKFSMPLSSSTLTTLKEKINSDPKLGPIKPTQQRLFHLGRELKSSNRSLEALGIGRFHVFTVHLHAGLETECLELLESEDEDELLHNTASCAAAAAAEAVQRSNRNRATTTTTTTTNGSNRRKHNPKNDTNEVVDLLDSDSDDDDDVVEIIEPTSSGGNKRRKRS
mmetsp:Transcript_12462/g.15941  ORF Transcript_12462/g.15941 Transcript_12462/m.15941 type:complete len:189 (+) Transcript_12462:207-773(+)